MILEVINTPRVAAKLMKNGTFWLLLIIIFSSCSGGKKLRLVHNSIHFKSQKISTAQTLSKTKKTSFDSANNPQKLDTNYFKSTINMRSITNAKPIKDTCAVIQKKQRFNSIDSSTTLRFIKAYQAKQKLIPKPHTKTKKTNTRKRFSEFRITLSVLLFVTAIHLFVATYFVWDFIDFSSEDTILVFFYSLVLMVALILFVLAIGAFVFSIIVLFNNNWKL